MNHVRLLASIAAGSLLLSATAMAQADPKKVERAWKSKCASCHGQTGKGDTEKGKELKVEDMTAAKYQGKKDDDLKKGIVEGVKAGGKEVMPAFKDELTPEQADALVKYTPPSRSRRRRRVGARQPDAPASVTACARPAPAPGAGSAHGS
jgi:mono/diheme cytochrome c family protein